MNVDEQEMRARIEQALLMIRKQQLRIAELEQEQREPIAVVGMSCRFPGGADPEAFWQLLYNGREAITEIPSERWEMERYYDPDPNVPGKMYTKYGAFLEGLDTFDARFFGISPREAAAMDPQQRLLLEVAWEAIEDAGYSPLALRDSDTGIFVGSMANEYAGRAVMSQDGRLIDAYTATGAGGCFLAGRLSFQLGFNGPSMPVDTACSSSLVAAHLACESLRARRCDLALAGGVNVILSPEMMVLICKLHALSPDGRCKTFDAAADGFGRGEGCGLIVLRRLSDALADGNRILAIIRGSAFNHDGHTSGITVPSLRAQQHVIRQALAFGRVNPHDISYVEAHGTGTVLGDPIELRALWAVLGEARDPQRPLYVGSVKTNVGHLEGAAGIAGLIKVILSLQHGIIPPHLHLQQLNPHIAADQLPLRIPTAAVPWSSDGRPRLAGVSSFGISGTNAHIVLEEPPPLAARAIESERTAHLLTLSARDENALRELARRYTDRLDKAAGALADFCYTANTGRAGFEKRAALVVHDAGRASRQLRAFADGEASEVMSGTAEAQPKIAFLFTGQGAQYTGMARQLYDDFPIFRQALERCSDVLAPQLGYTLPQLFFADGAPLHQTRYTQPALFALQVALLELWKHWGITPDVVLGHSVGEYAAAYAAGILDFEAGLRLIEKRAVLMGGLPAGGAMAAVATDVARLQATLEAFPGLSVAAYNGANIVLSGPERQLTEAITQCASAGMRVRRLQTSHAFHSAQLDPILDELQTFAAALPHRPPRIPLIGNLTGAPVEVGVFQGGAYWRHQTREPVRFAQSVRALEQQGCTVLLEIGPEPILLGMARHVLQSPGEDRVFLPSLRQGYSATEQMCAALGRLYTGGAVANFAAFDQPWPRRLTGVPYYPFQRRHYWITPPRSDTAQQTAPAATIEHLYQVSWHERRRQGRLLPAPFSGSLSPLMVRLNTQVPTLLKEHDFTYFYELAPLLDELALQYVRAAFTELGWEPCRGDQLSAGIDRLRSAPRYQRFIGRLVQIFEEAGLVDGQGSQRVLRDLPPLRVPEAFRQELLQRYPQGEIELTFLGRCGAALAAGLRGEVDPLGLIFPKDGSIGAAQVYGETAGSRVINGLLQHALLDLLQDLPADRPLRILEIGAGTGGTTRYLLPILPADRTEYFFTDVSAGFFNAAEAQFAAYPFVTYKVFDVNRTPAEQGLQPHTFDLVLAANALHAGTNLPRSVDHTLRLLAPNGLLLLLEGVYRQAWVDVSFGLLESWWAFNDELRLDHPLLSLEQWLSLLKAHTCTEATAVTARLGGSNQTLIVARAPATVSAPPLPPAMSAGVWILAAEEGGVIGALADRLDEAGAWGVLVRPGREYHTVTPQCFTVDPGRPEDFDRVLATVLADGRTLGGVIYAWGLDQAATDALWGEQIAQHGAGLFNLMQVMAERGLTGSPWILTRRQTVSTPDASPSGALLGALGQALSARYPELHCRHLALAPVPEPDEIEALCAELTSAELEDRIALGAGLCQVARCEPLVAVPGAVTLAGRQRGLHLISGGLSTRSLAAAAWLVRQGVQYLVLIDHRSVEPAQQQVIDHLREAGCRLEVWQYDLAQYQDMPRLRAEIEAAGLPLRGVWHSVEPAPVPETTWSTAATGVSALVDSMTHLEQLVAHSDLDVFIIMTPGFSLVPHPDYPGGAAGEACINAMLQQRRAHKQPALGVHWLAGTSAESMPVPFEQVAEAIAATLIAAQPPACVVVANASQLPGHAPLFQRLRPRLGSRPQGVTKADSSGLVAPAEGRREPAPDRFRERLLQVRREERVELLTRLLQEEVAQVLRLEDGDIPALSTGFFDMGMDSLMAIEVRDRLEKRLGLAAELSATALFDHPNIEALTHYLVGLLPGSANEPAAPPDAAPSHTARVADEPIAIIGLSCRFPNAPDVNAFRDLLYNGGDAITEVPPDRWDIDLYYDPDPEAPGRMYTRHGGFIQDIDLFDPQFFGISPREAISMDPQQRLLLEGAWYALEHAGLAADRLAGSRSGVFIGIANSDYTQLLTRRGAQMADAYLGSGISHSIAAGRISYVLGLHGPAMAIDTACSSSLVAIHQARLSLLHGECDLAIAGGVNAMLIPEVTIGECKAHMLSPDGRCKTFDAAANGFVRGEGCGLIVLKRLSDAVRDGDRVLAVIRGSALNQDGPSSGLTVPNGTAQQRLLLEALRSAGIEPGQVSYVEAHGTGTALGDPIEVRALAEAIGSHHSKDAPLLIGSVKTNLGHLETAAGIAGLIKIVLAMQENDIPPHLHLRTPNPHIPWGDFAVQVCTEKTPWPDYGGQRVAGVSAFGFSGTNAHIVLEKPLAMPRQLTPQAPRAFGLLAISARDQTGLSELARRYSAWWQEREEIAPATFCAAVNAGRAHHAHRAVFTVTSREQTQRELADFAAGKYDRRSSGLARHKPKVAFLFTGQGAQYPGMGRELYRTQPIFRAHIDRCAELLADRLGYPLLDLLFQDEAPLEQTCFTQPLLFVLETGLAAVWRTWGIVPNVVLGHSVGEYAAAQVAGVFSLEEGLHLITARGQLMQEMPTGAMLAVRVEANTLTDYLAAEPELAIAAYNGANTVLSGPHAAIQRVQTRLESNRCSGQMLKTSHAFHSALMEPMLGPFADVARSLCFRIPEHLVITNLTGRPLQAGETLDAAYWGRHTRAPVRFADGIESLVQLGCEVFLEIGPDATLLSMARTCLDGKYQPVTIPSLRRGQSDTEQLRQAVAALYLRGKTPDFAALDPVPPGVRLDLPHYPFQRERYWPNMAPQLPVLLAAHPVLPETPAATGSRTPSGIVPAWHDDLYEVHWRPANAVGTSAVSAADAWLILADAGGIGAALAERLGQQGQTCRVVSASAIDSGDAEAFAALLQGQATVLRHVVHLWSLDVGAAEAAASYEQAERLGWGSLLTLLRTMARTGLQARLSLVTRGAIAVSDAEDVNPWATSLWGLGKTIVHEHAPFWGKLIDLPLAALPTVADALAQALRRTDAEDQFALRQEQCLVARLQKAVVPHDNTPVIRGDATYLITGGLGGLGLHLARGLVERGARYLVLTARSDPSADASRRIEQLQARGAQVRVRRSDVSQAHDVTGLFADMLADMPPLRGIIHAAGSRDDSILLNQTSERFAAVMPAKAQGSLHLHHLSRDLPLDFFVVFSSIAATFGSPGQGNYAAANAFTDGLVHHRRALGRPALSINWGPWAEHGMAARLDRRDAERWQTLGLENIPPEDGVDALCALLTHSAPQLAVLRVDWQRLTADYCPPLLTELVAARRQPSRQNQDQGPGEPLPEQLKRTHPSRRVSTLRSHLQQAVARILQLDMARIDVHSGFYDYGMDSLMMVELRNLLQQEMGSVAELPATLAFDYPTVERLTHYLAALLGIQSETPPEPASKGQSKAASDDLDTLSEKELDALLDAELSDLD